MTFQESLLYWSFAAGLCTTIGAGMLFAKRNWSNRGLSAFLGLAAGVMTAVVLLDMMPSALLYQSGPAIGGTLLGMLLMRRVDRRLIDKINGPDTLLGLGYLIMLGIAMHDLPEGMAIALGGEMKARTGMVIALAIAIHNIPEGMAIAAPLLMGGRRRLRILVETGLIGLITPLGTIIGKMAISQLPQLLPWLLGLASGIMIYLVLFQLWPQAGAKDPRSRWKGFWIGVIIISLATFI